MNDCGIIDASAVLAYLNEEEGGQIIEAAFDIHPCLITSVNYCEVVGKLMDKNMPPKDAVFAVDALGLNLIAFDRGLAIAAAALRSRTMKIGASLGDRACLALAEMRVSAGDSPVVYTAERSWSRLKWPFSVKLARS